ncbi:MAG: hypothetical protein UT58_C0013G0004 [Microgenomates group bacterium GW2011_GWC1_39_7b]|uniref:Uncharacterized protein n=1 Tax=Candidatus Woesebacteria bacterium GW2011_GWA2_40_7 TaxID=1618562 RepID=A0A0G0T5P5_9BACT|nr:MAG: hypothetical protein UT58_C0013G0004 [Microgenomates group bacterium GW2011_GWC1_39_7b]KKR72314.1 MAG: hypothetical protein UU16_C0042G0002 [Candidatus Woesebacteria bacterium GW2011_GWA2_40_7]
MSREFLFEMDRRDFELDHGANIKEVQVARALVEGNIQIVNHFIDNGLFTRKRFEEILRDEELQGEYSQMAEALIRGIDDAFDLLYNDINKNPDTLCGWLLFYSEYLQTSLNMDLAHRTRLDYHFIDFKEANSPRPH